VGSRPSLKALEKRDLLPVLGIEQPVDYSLYQLNYGLTKFDICQPCTVLFEFACWGVPCCLNADGLRDITILVVSFHNIV